MDTSNPTATINVSKSSTTYKDYIEFTREPFDIEEFTIVLQDGRSYDLPVDGYKLFFLREGLKIPTLVIDVLFNFNIVRWYPDENRMEPM